MQGFGFKAYGLGFRPLGLGFYRLSKDLLVSGTLENTTFGLRTLFSRDYTT